MLEHFLRNEEDIRKIPEMEDHSLMPSRRRQLEVLMAHFKKFESITKNLQQQGLTPDVVRPVFEAAIEDYPEMDEHLGETATIVCNPDFENGLVKVMNGRYGSMTADIKAATERLEIERSESSVFRPNRRKVRVF